MSGVCTIRPDQRGEQGALAALRVRAARANAADRAFLDAHPEALDLPVLPAGARRVAVARDGGLAGFAMARAGDAGTREIAELFVDPAHQRRGIGRALVDRLAEEAGAAALTAVANPAAAGFYRACGFVAAGTAQVAGGSAPVYRREALP